MSCRHFFEALYSSMAAVLDEAFDRVGKQQAIHQELDRLFRCAAAVSTTGSRVHISSAVAGCVALAHLRQLAHSLRMWTNVCRLSMLQQLLTFLTSCRTL
jgi:hypothetical protein